MTRTTDQLVTMKCTDHLSVPPPACRLRSLDGQWRTTGNRCGWRRGRTRDW